MLDKLIAVPLLPFSKRRMYSQYQSKRLGKWAQTETTKNKGAKASSASVIFWSFFTPSQKDGM
jgi:hypothetical protein